ncbi:AAA family ATPase [Kocuria palustris]|uniref:McrB family protein n=1 Tax=Kocuria palustris TaxID=71999 RepID=UPI0021A2F737|nr:AAA family ATPase [Kocuria palustris]MCT1833303.1 AAA family ATPase [Kocuria palustris]MDH5150895.1 AAA family ATPase [Kocuria palustris]
MDLVLETVRVLRRFKNAVLEGPPGTGKSHVVADVVEAWERETGRKLVGDGRGEYAITLHPSTTYEEFVEGLRYDDDKSSFKRKDGFLRNVITAARKDPDSDYLVLIDELNRANVPKVFGDLLLTMEPSKRATWDGTTWSGGMEVTLPYSGTLFSVPSNVYLLGTMNTSDRSIAPLDSALRRRFGFIRVEPLVGDALRQQITDTDGPEAAKRVARSIDQLTNLNEALRICLGPNAMLGHSYLFGVDSTKGSVAGANDPLARVREAAKRPEIIDIFWLEARRMYFGNFNQLDIPEAPGKWGALADAFFPMSSNGEVTPHRSERGIRDHVDIYYDGDLFIGNFLWYNTGGSNYRLYYQGETKDGKSFASVVGDGDLQYRVHVWLRRSDHTLELMTLDSVDSVIKALQSVSVFPDGWSDRTGGTQGRPYGKVSRAALETQVPHENSDDEDAEWMIWRYAILPQLIDTATQVGATDLLAKEARSAWLEAANVGDVADRWDSFDEFLASLSLAIAEEGYGLTRGLTVVDIPVGAALQYVAPEASDEADDDGDQ